jgi:UPF0271 protein
MFAMSRFRPLILVVDTSALMAQVQYAAPDVELATTPLLLDEMHKHGLEETVQTLVDTQKMRILAPTQASLKTVVEAAKSLGDLKYLSEPDQQLLALALDLSQQGYRAVVLTDDYSIQNVAQRLSIDIRGVGQAGIRSVIEWETYCSACHRRFPSGAKGDICPVCGTPLKRRARRKQQVSHSRLGH